MIEYPVDVNAPVPIRIDDLATWLLFFLEAHGAQVTLGADRCVRVDLDTMIGMDRATAERLAPAIVSLIPEMRTILLARLVPRGEA